MGHNLRLQEAEALISFGNALLPSVLTDTEESSRKDVQAHVAWNSASKELRPLTWQLSRTEFFYQLLSTLEVDPGPVEHSDETPILTEPLTATSGETLTKRIQLRHAQIPEAQELF
jgi:hypothetical protein